MNLKKYGLKFKKNLDLVGGSNGFWEEVFWDRKKSGQILVKWKNKIMEKYFNERSK